MNNDPKYVGANFASLRFNASLLKPDEITFQKSLSYSGVTFCHALPEDDRFPVFDPALALPLLQEKSYAPNTRIICGHGHNPLHYSLPNLTLDVIGSTGCMDDGVPGMALYAMLYLSPEASRCSRASRGMTRAAPRNCSSAAVLRKHAPSWRISPVCSSSGILIT